MNTLAIAEIKRRGMAAIEEGLKHGPIHIIKRNKPAAVLLGEEEYQRLIAQTDTTAQPAKPAQTALEYLLNLESTGRRSKEEIDAWMKEERNW